MTTDAIDRILQSFDALPPRYPRSALDEALTLREEITPRLLEILGEVSVSPDRYAEGGFVHWHAATLLAHFQEPRAHLPLVRAVALDDDTLDAVWGDTITEILPRLLFKTCGGNLDAIKQLVLDKEAVGSVRWAAMTALVLAAFRGVATREEIVEFFAAILRHPRRDEFDDDFYSPIASSLTDLWPEGEVLPLLKAAWDEGLIDPMIVRWDDIEEATQTAKEQWLAQEQTRPEYREIATIHDYLSHWACFQPTPKVQSFNDAEKARKKAKKKMAAKSRKRNRK